MDVFLKASRLVKRRSVAKELCDDGAVLVNGRPARAGREIEAGDEVTLNLRDRLLSVSVAELPSKPGGAPVAGELYRILRDERRREGESDGGC